MHEKYPLGLHCVRFLRRKAKPQCTGLSKLMQRSLTIPALRKSNRFTREWQPQPVMGEPAAMHAGFERGGGLDRRSRFHLKGLIGQVLALPADRKATAGKRPGANREWRMKER